MNFFEALGLFVFLMFCWTGLVVLVWVTAPDGLQLHEKVFDAFVIAIVGMTLFFTIMATQFMNCPEKFGYQKIGKEEEVKEAEIDTMEDLLMRLATYRQPAINKSQEWRLSTKLSEECTPREQEEMRKYKVKPKHFERLGLNRGQVHHMLFGYKHEKVRVCVNVGVSDTERLKEKMCDKYCKWPEKWDEERTGCTLAASGICDTCPLKEM